MYIYIDIDIDIMYIYRYIICKQGNLSQVPERWQIVTLIAALF